MRCDNINTISADVEEALTSDSIIWIESRNVKDQHKAEGCDYVIPSTFSPRTWENSVRCRPCSIYEQQRDAYQNTHKGHVSVEPGRPSVVDSLCSGKSYPHTCSFGSTRRQSNPSQSGGMGHLQRPSSSSKEKAKMTMTNLASISMITYCMFLIVFGSISFIGSALTNKIYYAELFMICLMVIAAGYMLFLTIDIWHYIKKIKKIKAKCELKREICLEIENNDEIEQCDPIELSASKTTYECEPPDKLQLVHKYCFIRGRHGEFLYLKSGAAWFCFGLLIHSCLVIMYEVYYMFSSDEDVQKCGSTLSITFEIIFPIYAVFSLFFMYKYINLVINIRPKLARFMLIHMIATSVAFWIYQIVCETKEAILLADANNRGLQGIVTSRLLFLAAHCIGPHSLNSFYKNFSPYLYPFIIEFFILSGNTGPVLFRGFQLIHSITAGVWTMMFLNINKCPKRMWNRRGSLATNGFSSINDEAKSQDFCVDHDTHVRTSIEVHANCHGSNKGLFLGLVLTVMTICFIILFFITTSEKKHLALGLMLDRTFELIVLVVMIIAVIAGYPRISMLDINPHVLSKLDDVLLLLPLPACFAYAILSIIPSIHYGHIVNCFHIIAQVVQAFIQTPFITDGLRRCSNSKSLQKNKPGREFVTFLLIANISLWIYCTFSVKVDETGDERYEFYGYTLWSILHHLCLPLIMFYRFHSSVCLVDIWKHAYEPSDE